MEIRRVAINAFAGKCELVLDTLEIEPLRGPLRASVRPPGSKSITNRALVCAALASGQSTLTGALRSEDTEVMIDALQQLGIGIAVRDEGQTLIVDGCGGRIPARGGDLYVANSGTTMRFLTALVTVGHGAFRLAGVERMHARPIADLLDALRQLGATVRSEPGNGCPPVVIEASGLAGGRCAIAGHISSQFLSGLLLAAPYAQRAIEIDVVGQLVSQPYVTMTLEIMHDFGAVASADETLQRFEVGNQSSYVGREFAIEPDASAASYFFAAAAIAGGDVVVQGLSRESLQGDVDFCECLERMGCRVTYDDDSITVTGRSLTGIDVDMNAISDTVQTLAAVALFAEGTTTIRGVGHIRHKETDRIGDLATELRKLGATVDVRDDGLTITPGPLQGARVATYRDHRMAMSLALVGLRVPGVVIEDPACTAKTYPQFFEDLAELARGAK